MKRENRPWTENDKEKAEEMLKQGHSTKEIAEALNRTPAAINVYFTKFNIHYGNRGTRKTVTHKMVLEIIKLRSQGKSMAEIGEKVGLRFSTVGKVLKKNGVPLFYYSPVWTPELNEKLESYAKLDDCKTIADLAQAIGKTESSVKSRMANYYGTKSLKNFKRFLLDMEGE